MSGHFGTLCIKGLKFCYPSLKPIFGLFAAKKHELHAKEKKCSQDATKKDLVWNVFPKIRYMVVVLLYPEAATRGVL